MFVSITNYTTCVQIPIGFIKASEIAVRVLKLYVYNMPFCFATLFKISSLRSILNLIDSFSQKIINSRARPQCSSINQLGFDLGN